MARSRRAHRDPLWAEDALADNLYFFEPALARRRRLAQEAKDTRKAEEVDRSGSEKHLERVAKRLKSAKAEDRILYVPYWDMAKAEQAMRKAGVNGAVSNLCGSHRVRIRGRR
ncbi:MAG: hypothetical protein JNM59_09750 [Hyphomonadaceae bacterium]|nr:hypothetical protein [Hyphomonadaceae bacterium]